MMRRFLLMAFTFSLRDEVMSSAVRNEGPRKDQVWKCKREERYKKSYFIK